MVTRYRLVELDADLNESSSVALPGMPSRTRISPDGSLIATTTFVAGHSYMQEGFSTATEIRKVGGGGYGNLERFTLILDGKEVHPRDRNIWGVTFADDNAFYATVATGDHTWLVRGDLEARTLTSLRQNAECPSVSPDGARIAYKVGDTASGTHWSFAVLDLATDEETVLKGETANVDDQAEWLDDDTILYGLPRDDEAGVTDVWSLDTTADATPQLLIEQAWSPAVVR
ncbi:PD40 domain-containing protein [Nocardioides sp. GY 10113]|uniref:PD40 domain-containing protein n=1 Tax=Nocardioides sp. GY 10113 TaxID=2569761 RepID=UPI00197D1419|nr:PD40 domain-containing protein [Nocardioides sp. GY 10113]